MQLCSPEVLRAYCSGGATGALHAAASAGAGGARR